MEVQTGNIIALVLLTLVIIAVVITIIVNMGTQMKNQATIKIRDVFRDFLSSVTSIHNVCEAYNGKDVSLQDFQMILQEVSLGRCKDVHANVSLTFSLTKDDIKKLVRDTAIIDDEKLIFYNISEPIGTGGLIIQGEPGDYPLKIYDVVEIWEEGYPDPDIFIKVTLKVCDPMDEVCDALCIFKKVCDPVCDDGKPHNTHCNIACIDTNKNNKIDLEDVENRINNKKCNPDCYSNRGNPFKAYDPACIWKYRDQYDGICDPNTNGVVDGICDPDCVKSDRICDPDCDGVVSEGNPMGLENKRCTICDKECNGWCSPACEDEFGYPDIDEDCVPGGCCGDGICNTTTKESCLPEEEFGCPQDCPGGGTFCEDIDMVCCPTDERTDFSGCTPNKDLEMGKPCSCSNQCNNDLICDDSNHCCPQGETWNGTACEFKYSFTILFVQLNGQINNFKDKGESGKDTWVQLTPLKNCPDRVRAITVTDKVCSVPDQNLLCAGSDAAADETLNNLVECAKDWGYDGQYTRIVGVLPGSYVCSVGGGAIMGYTMGYGSPMVSAESSILATSSHEMGHTFGLCDEGYGGGYCPNSGCPSGFCSPPEGGMECNPGSECCPNKPEQNSIYCSANMCGRPCTYAEQFAPTSYAHLEKELNKYCVK